MNKGIIVQIIALILGFVIGFLVSDALRGDDTEKEKEPAKVEVNVGTNKDKKEDKDDLSKIKRIEGTFELRDLNAQSHENSMKAAVDYKDKVVTVTAILSSVMGDSGMFLVKAVPQSEYANMTSNERSSEGKEAMAFINKQKNDEVVNSLIQKKEGDTITFSAIVTGVGGGPNGYSFEVIEIH